jgi:hypothetical protein
MGGHGASTATVYFLFAKQLRNSGLPADVLVGKLTKDISFALRRGTIAHVTTALDAAQRAVEDEELVLNRGLSLAIRFDRSYSLCLSSSSPIRWSQSGT